MFLFVFLETNYNIAKFSLTFFSFYELWYMHIAGWNMKKVFRWEVNIIGSCSGPWTTSGLVKCVRALNSYGDHTWIWWRHSERFSLQGRLWERFFLPGRQCEMFFLLGRHCERFSLQGCQWERFSLQGRLCERFFLSGAPVWEVFPSGAPLWEVLNSGAPVWEVFPFRGTSERGFSGLGIRSFQKNVPIFAFFSVLYKRTERSFWFYKHGKSRRKKNVKRT